MQNREVSEDDKGDTNQWVRPVSGASSTISQPRPPSAPPRHSRPTSAHRYIVILHNRYSWQSPVKPV